MTSEIYGVTFVLFLRVDTFIFVYNVFRNYYVILMCSLYMMPLVMILYVIKYNNGIIP